MLPEEDFGRNVPFREYSLLDNPRAGVREGDILTGHVCQVPPASFDGRFGAHFREAQAMHGMCWILPGRAASCACMGIKPGQLGGDCKLPAAAAAGSAMALEANLEHAALVAVLAAHSSRQVLKLTDLQQLPGALPPGKERDRRVARSLSHLTGIPDRCEKFRGTVPSYPWGALMRVLLLV